MLPLLFALLGATPVARSGAPPIAPPVAPPVAADTSHCVAASRFLRDNRHMLAEVGADTIDDWRTGKHVPGCRITAAGATEGSVQAAAVALYDALRAAAWTRTPEPRDAPNEASLRFRHEQSDCLFNVNADAMLLTDAESRVNDALVVPPGHTRYQVFVMCMPAMPAKPRETGSS